MSFRCPDPLEKSSSVRRKLLTRGLSAQVRRRREFVSASRRLADGAPMPYDQARFRPLAGRHEVTVGRSYGSAGLVAKGAPVARDTSLSRASVRPEQGR
jgi:hypothetical protein